MRVSQTQGIGYPDVSVCYSCSNKDSISQIPVQTLTHQVVVMQHINCAIALDNNSTSSIKDFTDTDPVVAGVQYPAIPYAASPQFKTLAPYTDSTTMFTNLNSAHCGAFTAC